MTDPAFTLLFVADPAASTATYRAILGREPLEASPTFVMFDAGAGRRLGLWSRATAIPAPGPAGGTELGFPVAGPAEVDRLHAEWRGLGLAILQAPADMEFGRTFVATDADGHRLRVFAPGG